jgi:hypothetical protein
MYTDIEVLADRHEEQQKILQQITIELLENGEEVCIFSEETEDELPF